MEKGTFLETEKGTCSGAECVGCVGDGCKRNAVVCTRPTVQVAGLCTVGCLCEQTWDRFVCSLTLPIAAGDSVSWYLALFIGTLVTTL